MFPVIQIGPMALQTPGLILLVGLWLGLVLAERLAPRFHANSNHIYNLVFGSLIGGLIGARISYILQNYEAFTQSPLNIFSLNPGLLDPVGGVSVGVITSFVYGNRKKIAWWPALDALTPFFCVLLIALGFANLASGRAFGIETTVLWAIDLWGTTRHPTQIYQILTGCIILMMIWPRIGKEGILPRVAGETFVGFLALFAGAWLFIEAFRGDSKVLPNGIRVSQIIAWLVLAVSLFGFGKLHQGEYSE